ncbi:MAG: MucR family transcriptional regulator [Syntrophobacteraceae bacterium]
MAKKLVEIASEIVQSQVSLSPMSAGEIATSLREVFKTLQGMQKSEEEGTGFDLTQPAEEAIADQKATKVKPEDSILNDKIICLECGKEMRQLTAKHLSSHGMAQKEYKKKYGFPMKTPLAAKSLTKARSKAAKKRGLPENLTRFIEARRQNKADSGASQPGSSEDGKVQGRTKLRKRSNQA